MLTGTSQPNDGAMDGSGMVAPPGNPGMVGTPPGPWAGTCGRRPPADPTAPAAATLPGPAAPLSPGPPAAGAVPAFHCMPGSPLERAGPVLAVAPARGPSSAPGGRSPALAWAAAA